MLLLQFSHIIFRDVFERDNSIGVTSNFLCFATVLDPAANLKLEQQFGPIPLVCTLIVLVENLLRGSHGERLSHLYLKRCRIRFRTQPRLLLLEYA